MSTALPVRLPGANATQASLVVVGVPVFAIVRLPVVGARGDPAALL